MVMWACVRLCRVVYVNVVYKNLVLSTELIM